MNPELQCRFHKVSPIIPILSRINPILRIDTYFFKIPSNIVLPSLHRWCWSLDFEYWNKKISCFWEEGSSKDIGCSEDKWHLEEKKYFWTDELVQGCGYCTIYQIKQTEMDRSCE